MFILIVALITLISCLIYFKIRYKQFKIAKSILLSIYSLFLAFIVSMTFTVITAINCEYIITDTYETNIVCFDDSTYVYHDTHQRAEYLFMYDVPGKGLVTSRIPDNQTYIRYIDDSKMPRIIIFKQHLKNPVLRFITCDIGKKEEYAIFAPEDSIVNYEE